AKLVEEASSTAPAPAPAPAPRVKAKKKAKPSVARPVEEAISDEEGETPEVEAWNYLHAHKGDNEDQIVTEAWVSAIEEVGPDREAKDLTEEDWTAVRDIVVKDLDLNVE
ncbi:hypothetical protein LCGC14_1462320, partial [marine sediment metagenome]